MTENYSITQMLIGAGLSIIAIYVYRLFDKRDDNHKIYTADDIPNSSNLQRTSSDPSILSREYNNVFKAIEYAKKNDKRSAALETKIWDNLIYKEKDQGYLEMREIKKTLEAKGYRFRLETKSCEAGCYEVVYIYW